MLDISECESSGDTDETINHIISKSSKLEQKSVRLDTTEWGR